jgi:hypothetical protein
MNSKRTSKKILRLDRRVKLLSDRINNDENLHKLQELRSMFNIDDILKDRHNRYFNRCSELINLGIPDPEVDSIVEKEFNMSSNEIFYGTVEELEFKKKHDQYHNIIMEYPIVVTFFRLISELRELQKERKFDIFGIRK